MQSASESVHGREDQTSSAGRLENLTLWQRVHDHLREEILAGRLPAGTELQEVALAAELGVSRGPLREAIGRLAAEGLVTVRPRRGAVVRSLSSEEVPAFFEANVAFHERILEASGNAKLQTLYGQLIGQMGRYRMRSLTLRG